MLDHTALSYDLAYGGSAAITNWSELSTGRKTASKRRQDISQSVAVTSPVEVQLANSAMTLKIATSKYAMYLGFIERDRLFSELDFLLDADGWFEEDSQPNLDSFVNFLKWLVETRSLNWVSLGLDAAGNALVAYKKDDNVVTAAFLPDGKVQWTCRITSEEGVETSSGSSPLFAFVGTSKHLLEKVLNG
ncbi:hypothetical protein PMI07_002350 [Rhizobium sp. CF080]|uniref:hypothetical protein n=1 Tax=Rhizobium sp. (strain CF080) TaxID=1144310 RepID=UPI000271781A|nr:hypothetical protein [Rhizobium sp. CF080]EUB95862.1 hypothetical protein PMI07_002350 [Rhizobium sp. CF080]